MKPSAGSLASLPEVHATVGTERSTVWRRMLAFAGPAYLVSVGRGKVIDDVRKYT